MEWLRGFNVQGDGFAEVEAGVSEPVIRLEILSGLLGLPGEQTVQFHLAVPTAAALAQALAECAATAPSSISSGGDEPLL